MMQVGVMATGIHSTPAPRPLRPAANDRWLWLAAIMCAGAACGLAMFDDLALHVGAMWVGCLVCLAGCGLGAWRVQQGRGSVPLILGCAVLMRLALLPTEPSLSDDIYRYLWDGRVQLAGLNPYAHAPDSEAVAHLRDELWEQINHRQVPTVYPPLAQWLFAGVVGLGGGIVALKLALLLCEAGAIAAVIGLLRHRGRDPAWVLLYAWHPLPVLEIAGSGHVDALGIGALMLSLLWLVRCQRLWAAAGLAAAILAKLIPVLCALAFWRTWHPVTDASSNEANSWRAWLDPRPQAPLLLTGALVLSAYGWFLLDGAGIFSGLQTYALKWRFNDGVFAGVYYLLRDPELSWDDAALLQARQVCLVLWGAVALLALRWRDPLRICFALLGAYTVLSPTVHPWYLLWVLPFLPLFPRPAWLALSGLILLSYEVLIGYRSRGLWEPADWAVWVQYGPFFLLLVIDMWHRWCTPSATSERLTASDV